MEPQEEQTFEYLYRSAGGCSRCDAMEGYYQFEPARPHPNCQCEITLQDPTLARHTLGDDRGHGWHFDFQSSDEPQDRDGDNYYETHVIHGHLYVWCCDQVTVFDEEIELELILGPGDDTAEKQSRQFEEMYQKAENRARELMERCSPCGPPPLVS